MITIQTNAADFQNQLQAFVVKAKRKTVSVFNASTKEVERSVKDGSPLTGAPGQPIRTGYLILSWKGRFVGPFTWEYTTPVDYAPAVENKIVPIVSDFPPKGYKSPVDLPKRPAAAHYHSVKLTRGGWKFIVDDVSKRVAP
jgi:hypothetical protein